MDLHGTDHVGRLPDNRVAGITLPSFAQLERTIEQGLASFVDVGQALIAIKANKLYKEHGYSTFEDYCERRWDISRQHGHRILTAAATAEKLLEGMSPIGDIPQPQRESQVRPLAVLADPTEIASAWSAAVADADGGQPTAAQVAAAVTKVTERESRSATVETPVPQPPANVDLNTGEIIPDPIVVKAWDEMQDDPERKRLATTDDVRVAMKHVKSLVDLDPSEVAAALDEQSWWSFERGAAEVEAWFASVRRARPNNLRLVKES